MKIAMLTSDYLPNIGGIASHIYELSKALIAQGNDVEIWYWDRKNELPAVSTMGEIPLRFIDVDPALRGSFKISRQLAQSITKNLLAFPADLLHLHTMDPLLLSTRKLRKFYPGKILWTNHSSRFIRRKSESFFWRQKMKFYTAAIDGLLTASNDRLEASRFLNVANTINIPNGVNIEQFIGVEKSVARAQLDIKNDCFVILYTGRFAPVKGVNYLAQALVQLNQQTDNFICIMCGNIDGDRESATVKAILHSGNATHRYRLEGFVPNSQLKIYLAACDVLVLPSLQEATSISGLEAMAASRPIVGTRIGGITELIDDGVQGILVAPKDPDDLCRGLQQAMASDALEVMGENAHLRVQQRFTWQKTARSIQQFYQQVTDIK
ncbi:MAG: glycosyltransferase involved in cell wall biosynthesis [Paraglaciecola psychrophila]|jgi:glycosyltransferase involved in cell wall biosynthesis